MKKIIALLSALSLTASLAACDNSSTAEESSAGTTTTGVTTTKTEASTTTATTEPPLPPADPNAITFDTPSLYTAHCMGSYNFEDGEADCNLDIVELDGERKLRVQVLTKNEDGEYAVPKIVFSLPQLLGQENISSIGHVSVDLSCVARETTTLEDGTDQVVVGYFGGSLSGNLAEKKLVDDDGNLIQNPWADHKQFGLEDWEHASHTWRVEFDVPKSKLPVNDYAADYDGATLVLMRWAQKKQVDIYLDNITFFDKDGNSMPIIYDAESDPAMVVTDTVTDTADGTAPAETTEAADSAAE